MYMGLASAELAAEVYKLRFNMSAFGGPSLKPTMLLTNNAGLRPLAQQSAKNKRAPCKDRTTKRYLDKQGVTRFCGTAKLKASQPLCCSQEFCCFSGRAIF